MIRLTAFALSLLAASTLNWSAPTRAETTAAPGQRLGRITIRSVGTGSPVVLIPGLASPPAVFDGLTAKIGGNHRLIFVQVNGFAGSPAGNAPLEGLLSGAVDELASWLAANHIEKPAVIGHSMGGLMAMMLAKAHPHAAGKLLVVDSLPFYGMLFGPQATPDAIRPMVEQMRTGLVNGASPLEVPPHMSTTDAGKAKILEWLKASDRRVVGEALVEDSTTDFRPNLSSLAGTPVTVLYAVPSADSKPMISGLYQNAYKALPGVTLVPVENSEHFIMLDQPSKFVEAVEDFLR